MARCLQHNNAHLMAAIDVETTGLDPNMHEIWNLAIIPLDADFQPLKGDGIFPFEVLIRPEDPALIDWNIPVFKRNRTRIAQAINEGYDRFAAIDLFENWYAKLRIPETKRIMPLGQNYQFDKSFISMWLGGQDMYEPYFHYHYRDTMIAAHYINDRLAFRGESVAFPKQNLEYLCSTLHIENEAPHTAIGDAMATARVYREMMNIFLR